MSKKIISVGLALVMILTLGMTALAANEMPATTHDILDDIIEYSFYDYETKSWELDYAIVEDGILTDSQYTDAEEIGDYYTNLIGNDDVPQTRALPAVVVLVLKAIAAAGGAALAAEIVSDIYNFGMTAACENFSGVDLFRDFCEANGYI